MYLLWSGKLSMYIAYLKEFGSTFTFTLQDFDATMSAMSTARVDSPGGKISPLAERLEEERKRRAEMAASAAERWVKIDKIVLSL